MPHPRAIARVLLAAVALCAACDSPRRPAVNDDQGVVVDTTTAAPLYAGTDRGGVSVGRPQTVASLPVVQNPDTPVLGSGGGVKVEMVWSRELPHDVAPLGHVLALQPPWVHVLHGGEVQTLSLNTGHFEPPSAGIVEFSARLSPNTTSLTVAGDRLVVGDSARGTATLASASGDTATVYIGAHPYLQGMENGDFVANAFGGSTLVWQHRRPNGTRSGRIQLPVPPADAQGARCPVVTGGRWLLIAACAYPAFRIASTDGTLVREVRINRQIVDTTTASPAPPGFVPAQWPGRSSDLRDEGYLPHPNLGVRFDPRSGLFAMVWHNPASPESRVELFTAEGVYLVSLRFRGAWMDFGFWNSTLYALTYDSASRWPKVSAYRLTFPPLPGA